jgi:hypothetical protein
MPARLHSRARRGTDIEVDELRQVAELHAVDDAHVLVLMAESPRAPR